MPKKPTTTIEKAAISAAMLALVLLAIFFVRYFYGEYDVTSEASYADNLPVDGQHASILSINTHWQQDPETKKVYPYATIQISPASNSGTLRALFYQNKSLNDFSQTVVGDPHTLSFSKGKFSNGTDTITIKCSQGIYNLAEYLGYSDQDEYRWTINVRESSGLAKNSSDFSPLAHSPIVPTLVESR